MKRKKKEIKVDRVQETVDRVVEVICGRGLTHSEAERVLKDASTDMWHYCTVGPKRPRGDDR